MGELLNIDGLVPEEKYVTYGGKPHAVTVNSMQAWIRLMQKQEEIAALSVVDENDSAAAVLLAEMQVEIIDIACPSLGMDVIRTLPVRAITQIVDIINSEMDPDG